MVEGKKTTFTKFYNSHFLGYTSLRKENDAIITPEDIDVFLDKWAEYDPDGTGFITPDEYLFLVNELSFPLGRRDEKAILDLFQDKGFRSKNFLNLC